MIFKYKENNLEKNSNILRKKFYDRLLMLLIIKKGKKLKAKNIVVLFLVKVKKFLLKKKFRNKFFDNKIYSNFLFFFIFKIFEKYRPKVGLLYKKVAAKGLYIPTYITYEKSQSLILRWFIQSALNRKENNFSECLFKEFIDLCSGKGLTIKKLEEYYTIAVSNRPFLKLLRKRKRVSRSRLKKYSL